MKRKKGNFIMNESSSVRLACYGIHKKLPFVVVASRSGYLGCYVGMSKKIRKMFNPDMMDENITYDTMDAPSVGIPSKPHAEWWIGFSTYGFNKNPISVPSVEVLKKYFSDIDESDYVCAMGAIHHRIESMKLAGQTMFIDEKTCCSMCNYMIDEIDTLIGGKLLDERL